MNEQKYTFEEVVAYAVIGLFNLLNSANKENIDLRTIKMFVEPLERLYEKENAVELSRKLLEAEAGR